MAFSYGTAISRIDTQPEPVWTPGMSADQKLQRLNEVLERFWTVGTWDGLLEDVSITTSGGIVTLDPAYKTLEALVVDSGERVSIKSQQWKYTPSAPKIRDWNQYGGPLIAFDLGDSLSQNVITDPSSGKSYVPVVTDNVLGISENPTLDDLTGEKIIIDQQTGRSYTLVVNNEILGINGLTGTQSPATCRRYQIAGDSTRIDAFTFKGMARRRYLWATSDASFIPNTNSIVTPDCFQALLMGLRSFHWHDVGDTQRGEEEFKTALNTLEQDLGIVLGEEDLGNVTVDFEYSGGSICNLM